MKQEPFFQEEILGHLTEKPEQLLVYDTLDSTNTEAKRLIAKGAPSGTVILADGQTEGRGRMGKSFFSPKGTGLYLSVILKHSIPVEELCLVTPFVAVVACHAIYRVCEKMPRIKWVNDLYLDGKKVCGILTELSGDALIIGIGVNCTTDFQGELSQIAGSLNRQGIRSHLAAELIGGLLPLEQGMKDKKFLDDYRKHSMLIGKTVTVVGEEGCYLAEGIGDRGELLLRATDGALRVLRCGEVSVTLIK